jgi:photosystem II stability/assembly factor-like uncharacterized protein
MKRSFRPTAVLTLVAVIFLLSTLLIPGTLAASGWQPQVPGTGNQVMAVEAVDSNTAWAVGGATILKTTDGGATWVAQVSGTTSNLRDISAVNAQTAWAVGDNGCVLETTDGGTTWTPHNTNPLVWVAGVAAIDENTAWITGMSRHNNQPAGALEGIIEKTTDGGASWVPQLYVTNSSVEDISALDAGTAWAVTQGLDNSGGYVYYTDNGGSAWFLRASLPPILYAVDAVDSNTVWAVGFGNVWRSTSGGFFWEKKLGFANGAASGVSAVSADTAWVTEGGCIFKTSDGGSSWHDQYQGSLYDISAVDANTVWAVGGNTILHTTDGGGTQSLPFIGGISVNGSGYVGTSITINGISFGATHGSSQVSFGSVPVSEYTSWSDKQITCNIPDVPAGYNPVTVTTPDGVSNVSNFYVVPLPAILVTSFTPASGPNTGNLDVEITGRGFKQGDTVQLVGLIGQPQPTIFIDAINVVAVSDTKITCTFPLAGKPTGKYGVVVTSPDGSHAGLVGFSVTDACGQGGGGAITLFAGLVGLMSLVGIRYRRKPA